MCETIIDGIVDGVVFEVVVSTGIGIEVVVSFLYFLHCFFLPNLVKQHCFQIVSFHPFPVLHLSKHSVLGVVAGTVLLSLEHEVEIVEVICSSGYFERTVFYLLWVYYLRVPVVPGLFDLVVVLCECRLVLVGWDWSRD